MRCLVLALVCLMLTTASAKCPHENCDCSNIASGHVSCENITFIPEDFPSAMSLLDISGNDLGPVIYEEEMEPLRQRNLLYLYMNRAKIEYIDVNSFSNMTSLRTLDLGNNPIGELFPSSFYGLANLWSLILSNCSLIIIEEDTFYNTKLLFHLDLHNNNLTSITTQFSMLENLKTLLLHRNQLEFISPTAFDNLESLTHLSLYSNKLTTPYWSWFNSLIANMGVLELDTQTKFQHGEMEVVKGGRNVESNPWKCCFDMIVYAAYLGGFNSDSYILYNQLDITCQTPFYKGYALSDLSLDELNIACDAEEGNVMPREQEPRGPSVVANSTKPSVTHSDGSNPAVHALDIFTGGFGYGHAILKSNPKSLSEDSHVIQRWSNVQLAIIIAVVCVIICVIIILLVSHYNKKQYQKDLTAFMHELPVSENGGENGENQVSTIPFRPNLTVYGSSGSVINRNTKLASEIEHTPAQIDSPSMKRKPPPYSPPKKSGSTESSDENALRSWRESLGDDWEVDKDISDQSDDFPAVNPDDFSEDEIFNSDAMRRNSDHA